MDFNKLYRLILENDEQLEFGFNDPRRKAPVPDDESWTDYFDDHNYGITIDELKFMVDRFDLTFRWAIEKKILNLSDDNSSYWFKTDDGDEYEVWETSDDDLNSNIYQMQDYEILKLIGLDYDDIYIDGWECTLKDMKENPGTVYHYTTEEGWEGIQKKGYISTKRNTFGMTNRSIGAAIFCSTDPEEHAVGSYGNICLALNLGAFKEASKLPKLDVEPEPEVLEVAIRNLFRYKLGINDNGQNNECPSSDISCFTVAVGHQMPIQFVERLN